MMILGVMTSIPNFMLIASLNYITQRSHGPVTQVSGESPDQGVGVSHTLSSFLQN
jgi:hypothetical protein